MEKFTTLTSYAAPLLLENVDTDMIIPKQFLKTVKRTGLGPHLFDDMRYINGQPNPDFVLNQPPFNKAQILLGGKNFGCGSSREHAPWALSDFGIRCIIAPSFADIFYNNCAKNGILLIKMSADMVEQLALNAKNEQTNVDLVNQVVVQGDLSFSFDIEPTRKRRLLEGWDDIAMTQTHADAIRAFEDKRKQEAEWL